MIKGMALKGGNRFSLVLGIGLGVVAAVLIAVYLTGAKSDSGGGTVGGSGVPVVVAAVEIQSGTKIDAGMLTVKDFPDDAVLTGAFPTVEEVAGRVTTTKVIAGEQVIADKITATGDGLTGWGSNPPLAIIVTEGFRGTAIEVNNIVGAGGNIRPGDYVDVILSITIDAGDAEHHKDQVAAIVLQNLQVLALDQSIAANRADAPTDQKDTEEKATTVTLLATPTQSEVLALVDTCRSNFGGRIALAVRSFGDDVRFAQRSEWPEGGEPPTCAALFGLQFLP
jgi:pilus assembly protein CpaB